MAKMAHGEATAESAFVVRLTVVICTHNPRPHYLERVLSGLRRQTFPKEEWELLFIDNASDCPLADRWDISWHPNGRHVFEPKLGLAQARKRGIKESQAAVIIFVDDDNVLDVNYLAEAAKIGQEWPQIGTWGAGIMEPEYEVQPEPEVKELLYLLAIRDSAEYPCAPELPVGAGLCIRTNMALTHIRMCEDSEIVLTGRLGNGLMRSEDLEMSYTANEVGFGAAVFPQLRLTHLIPKERVARRYLVDVYGNVAMSNALLAYKWDGVLPPSQISVRGLLSFLKNIVLRHGIRREMHFHRVRALMSARRLIAQTDGSTKPLRTRVAKYFHPTPGRGVQTG
jgi:glycosyltransferase involved in cell wall biosynthesis